MKSLSELRREQLLAMAKACRLEMRSHAMSCRASLHTDALPPLSKTPADSAAFYLDMAKQYRQMSHDYKLTAQEVE
jgi:hypothetical protein